MINLEISNYKLPYAFLNGYKTQNVKPFDLSRALVTIGHGSWSAVFKSGIFRIGELICKALAFSKLDQGNLVLHDRFFNLTQSEKAIVSYYFGQGLTKLYAEKFLKIKWLFNVEDFNSCIQFNVHGNVNPKVIVGRTNRNAERPDFIGIKQRNQIHIFESKGHSGGYDISVMQHAINQVSQINTYNKISPETRTACFYDLSTNPIRGIIIDPDNEEKGIEIIFDEEAALNKFYSFFIENRRSFNAEFQYRNNKFCTTPVGVPNIFFGFDKRILDLKPVDILERGLYGENNDFQQSEDSRFSEVSLGLDGFILINK